MKYIKFLLISIFMPNLLFANGIPEILINEIYFYDDSLWQLELKTLDEINLFDSLYLKTKSDSAYFVSYKPGPGGIKLIDPLYWRLLGNPVHIDKNGDTVEIKDGHWGSVVANIYFGPGEKYKAPGDNRSICLDGYSFYAEYYLDNSPTPGGENDALDARCTIRGRVKDSWNTPISNVRLCLNKYHGGLGDPYVYCRDTVLTNTEGLFEFHPLAFAFLSNIQFTKYGYNGTKIDSLDLSPDSTYDLETVILTGGSSVPEDKTSINQFNLSQNYPNPFTRETQIVFTLPEELPTLLEVYNSQGQKIKTLVKGIISRGKHEVALDGTSLSSGVYIYKLRAGRHYSDSKKFILTK